MRFSSWLSFLCASLFAFLVVVACGRTSLEPETLGDGGTTTPKACSASTCPTGCCDGTGTCRTGGDNRACGSGGGRCNDCVAQGFTTCTGSKVCARDDANCSPKSCSTGCCGMDAGRLRCLAGTEAAACGIGGGLCVDCSTQGRACDPSTRTCGRQRCNKDNCKGCCVNGTCLEGNKASACGTRGEQCESCAPGQTCTSEPGGGGQCEGTTNCGPLTCGGGCCQNGKCQQGIDDTACGKGGFQCQDCQDQVPAKICVADGLPNERTCQVQASCSAANCAGCCSGTQCVSSPTAQACGANGNACVSCKMGETCLQGQCTPATTCSDANCGVGGTVGCCAGNICAAGTQKGFCGVGGEACKACAGTDVCQGGVCQPAGCNITCATGCCSGNTCTAGIQDNACGIAGNDCVDCTQFPATPSCNGVTRQCVQTCGPANCPTGCCQNNACLTGNTNAACGTGGIACATCIAPFTCNATTKLCTQ